MRIPRELLSLLRGPSMAPEGPRARTVTGRGHTVTPEAGGASEDGNGTATRGQPVTDADEAKPLRDSPGAPEAPSRALFGS